MGDGQLAELERKTLASVRRSFVNRTIDREAGANSMPWTFGMRMQLLF